MKSIFLDIMIKDRFYCQLMYEYCPLWPIDLNDVIAFIHKMRPSLQNREYQVAFSEQSL